MKPKIILSVLCILTLATVLSAVAFSRHNQSDSGPAGHLRTFQVHGQILAVDRAGKKVRIAHEAIPDYMPAMTMPFPVKNGEILSGLSPGENVQFELDVTVNDSWVSHIEKIAEDSPTEIASIQTAATSVQDYATELIQVGEEERGALLGERRDYRAQGRYGHTPGICQGHS